MKNLHLLFVFLTLILVVTLFPMPKLYAQTTITLEVSAGTDDVRAWDSAVAPHTWDGVNTGATNLFGGYVSILSRYEGAGMRFLNVTIPQGSTIDSAFLNLTATQTRSETTVNTNITAEDVDNSATFSDLADYNGRSRTGNITVWDNIGSWTTDVEYQSPAITNVIQEVIDIATWSSGNNLTVFWEDDGSTATALTYRSAYAQEGTGAPPTLIITYSTGEQTENFFGSITQSFNVSHAKNVSFNRYPSITQSFSVNHGKTVSFNLYGSITQLFTVNGVASIVSGTILNLFGSITQTFTVNGWTDLTPIAVTATGIGIAVIALVIALFAIVIGLVKVKK